MIKSHFLARNNRKARRSMKKGQKETLLLATYYHPLGFSLLSLNGLLFLLFPLFGMVSFDTDSQIAYALFNHQ